MKSVSDHSRVCHWSPVLPCKPIFRYWLTPTYWPVQCTPSAAVTGGSSPMYRYGKSPQKPAPPQRWSPARATTYHSASIRWDTEDRCTADEYSDCEQPLGECKASVGREGFWWCVTGKYGRQIRHHESCHEIESMTMMLSLEKEETNNLGYRIFITNTLA